MSDAAPTTLQLVEHNPQQVLVEWFHRNEIASYDEFNKYARGLNPIRSVEEEKQDDEILSLCSIWSENVDDRLETLSKQQYYAAQTFKNFCETTTKQLLPNLLWNNKSNIVSIDDWKAFRDACFAFFEERPPISTTIKGASPLLADSTTTLYKVVDQMLTDKEALEELGLTNIETLYKCFEREAIREDVRNAQPDRRSTRQTNIPSTTNDLESPCYKTFHHIEEHVRALLANLETIRPFFDKSPLRFIAFYCMCSLLFRGFACQTTFSGNITLPNNLDTIDNKQNLTRKRNGHKQIVWPAIHFDLFEQSTLLYYVFE